MSFVFAEEIKILEAMPNWLKDALKNVNDAVKRFVESNAHLLNVIRELFEKAYEHHDLKYKIPKKKSHTCKKGSFKCSQCNSSFKIKKYLQKHIHNYHTHPFSFKCSICNKKYYSSGGLVCHNQCTHSNKTWEAQNTVLYRGKQDILGQWKHFYHVDI